MTRWSVYLKLDPEYASHNPMRVEAEGIEFPGNGFVHFVNRSSGAAILQATFRIDHVLCIFGGSS